MSECSYILRRHPVSKHFVYIYIAVSFEYYNYNPLLIFYEIVVMSNLNDLHLFVMSKQAYPDQ